MGRPRRLQRQQERRPPPQQAPGAGSAGRPPGRRPPLSTAAARRRRGGAGRGGARAVGSDGSVGEARAAARPTGGVAEAAADERVAVDEPVAVAAGVRPGPGLEPGLEAAQASSPSQMPGPARRRAAAGLPRPDAVALVSASTGEGVRGLLVAVHRLVGGRGDVWVVRPRGWCGGRGGRGVGGFGALAVAVAQAPPSRPPVHPSSLLTNPSSWGPRTRASRP